MQTKCAFNYDNCVAQTGCNATLACREACRGEPDKLLRVDCFDGCQQGRSTNALTLYNDINACFLYQCEQSECTWAGDGKQRETRPPTRACTR